MKATTQVLAEAIQKIGASVYEGQEVGNGSSETEADPTSDGSSEDDVIDGEVTE